MKKSHFPFTKDTDVSLIVINFYQTSAEIQMGRSSLYLYSQVLLLTAYSKIFSICNNSKVALVMIDPQNDYQTN